MRDPKDRPGAVGDGKRLCLLRPCCTISQSSAPLCGGAVCGGKLPTCWRIEANWKLAAPNLTACGGKPDAPHVSRVSRLPGPVAGSFGARCEIKAGAGSRQAGAGNQGPGHQRKEV